MTVLVLNDDALMHMAISLIVGDRVPLLHVANEDAFTQAIASRPTALIVDSAAQAFDPAELVQRCLEQHRDVPTVVIGAPDSRLQSILSQHPNTLMCGKPHEEREAISDFLGSLAEA